MIRLTLAQMRRTRGRLAAAALAIVVGTAFVAATLLGGALIRDTTHRAVTASLADADVVAYPADRPFDDAAVRTVSALDGVTAADGATSLYGQVSSGGRQDAAALTATPSAEALDPFTLVEGSMPTGADGIALTEASAERLGAAVGEAVQVEWQRFAPEVGDGTGQERVSESVELTLTGILVDPPAMFASASSALVTRANLEQWLGEVAYESILVAGDGTPEALAEQVRSVLPQAVVRTAQQEAEQQTEDLTGSSEALTYLVLGFAAVAMFVAALVIANTFQVLVAQRTRTLALLRCVGATRSQVHRSVLLEALILGVLAGAGGLGAGLGLGQGAVWLLGRADLGLELPDTITVTPAVVIAPLVTGAVVTVLAALTPARVATRVAPLAALRPAASPRAARSGGRVRLVLAVTLGVTGALLLAGASVGTLMLAERGVDALGPALVAGILGGMLSFAGVMVGAVFLVPGAVRALGTVAVRAARRRTTQLATVNATRNPRRTSATASALLIGVALVMMMSTGAASMRASLGSVLDEQFPVDLAVSLVGAAPGAEDGLTGAQLDALSAVEDVEQVAPLPTTEAWVVVEETARATVAGLDAEAAATVLHDPSLVTGLQGRVALVSPSFAETLGVEDGDAIGLTPADADGSEPAGAPDVTVTAQVVPIAGNLLVTPEVLTVIDPRAPVLAAWARLAEEGAAGTVLDVQDALAEATPAGQAVPFANGPAAERQQLEQVIDTLLAIVVGLLAVAVVIALIGVANTLSLSVIERSREHALLRAMGLTRGQLRGMLAVEGVLIALTGTVLGAVLGLVYGWAGTTVLLGATGEPQLAVPWVHLVVVLVVAVLAGLAASVLPARAALRTPPVAALAA
ncbi:FtsX-like permease family protein [Georgenia sp. 10Sc9-8]|uniref:FtsX-like permease family protein n=1 Tax=Georgenia halotolerans TaxID=3028317 RepID=A0ABT5U116_9MICO|nr:FtsX-like permease family protein [Georgenia halotolerans]